MKYLQQIVFTFLVTLNLVVVANNAQETPTPPAVPAFTIVSPPPFVTIEMREPVDSGLLHATLEWLSRNRVESCLTEKQPEEAEIYCRLILDPTATERDYKTAIDLNTNSKPAVVTLYAAALLDPAITPDSYEKRVTKEALRGVLLALDMPACVFFLCNMYEHTDTEALDRKSTNPCPPCQGRFEEWLKANHLLPQVTADH